LPSAFDLLLPFFHCQRMRWLIVGCWLAGLHLLSGEATEEFVASAAARHGPPGERAARFLVDHMPVQDRERLSTAFLMENLDLAFQARSAFRWATEVPEEIFLNDVLPYAVFDEPRDPWRAQLFLRGGDLVHDAGSASEAAQILNREIFKLLKVHYNPGRRRPNQSLKESMATGKATCTGLSIILVNACRAVGIPARAVGTPLWANQRGNHTWVEIWDSTWHFTGADEYDPAGLNRGWFVGDAAQALVEEPRHAIYATSWRHEGLSFPMVWARRNQSVAAVNVTSRYAKPTMSRQDQARLGVRLWDRLGGSRMVARVEVLDAAQQIIASAETRAGTADLNDMPRFELAPGTHGTLRFVHGEQTREMPFGSADAGDPTVDAVWSELTIVPTALWAIREWLRSDERCVTSPALRLPLNREEAEQAIELLAADVMTRLAADRAVALEQLSLTHDDKTLRWTEKTLGEPPSRGHSLWISMHGGGNAPAAVNDRQWQNQSRLYEPAEGIYVAPRAPTDTWNLWHESHIDPMFQQLIETYVAVRGVNPDRIYLLGYSAGGDGVWQLAPRMADRFAAAAMMAGHPNEATLLSLRNLPFAILMGAEDAAYHRNLVATQRATELERLAKEDPDGYPHFVRIYEGLGHWMKGKDAEALPWMAGFERDPWPRRIVWQQDDIVHRRFYWLRIPEPTTIEDRAILVAAVSGQTITLEGDVPAAFCLRLSDRLLDLDAPIVVRVHDKELFSGRVQRQASAILDSLLERADPASVATAILSSTARAHLPGSASCPNKPNQD
jgi:hypothetical protein